jgi:hypothetical protein
MVPIIVTWTQYTARVRGRVLKLVPCENCKTEYVYVLEREGVGAGTSVYGLADEAAQEGAASGAEEVLGDYLTNDFDPVPCPACGHYQRFMFPKLDETKSPWAPALRVGTLGVGMVSLVASLYWGINLLLGGGDRALMSLGVWAPIMAVAGGVGFWLWASERRRVRRFDPNALEDVQSRIAKGRARAVTRAAFDARQVSPPKPPTDQ